MNQTTALVYHIANMLASMRINLLCWEIDSGIIKGSTPILNYLILIDSKNTIQNHRYFSIKSSMLQPSTFAMRNKVSALALLMSF